MLSISSFIAFLVATIPDKPGFIVGPISWILGGILNFVYDIVSLVSENFSLGVTIIIVTIIVRCLMIPLALKQQKSMVVMRKIQPEIKKIQDKYKDDMADPEVKRKMNTEMQKLYSKHSYNPFSGCLPLIVQLPIFIALYYIMQNPYAYIDTIGQNYTDISNVIIEEVTADKDEGLKLLEKSEDIQKIKAKGEAAQTDADKALILEYDGNKWVYWSNFVSSESVQNAIPKDTDDGVKFDFLASEDLNRLLSKLTPSEWDGIKEHFNSDVIVENLNTKDNIESFGFGINLTETAGFGLPGIFITLLSGLTTFLSSWLMMRKNKNMGGAAASQQKIMMITMPLMMAWITSGLPCGVGLYWISSNIFMIVQQQVLNKYYENKLGLEDDKNKNVIDEVPIEQGNGKNKGKRSKR